ncbi:MULTISPECIES: cob(I)yrinic acid a,c-diamide adenosyltransferase [unclassified Iodidimonas]|jgi:cob(I)alamin adenosyltransferase|uniref:cob(I)yrinic acid a,c-diamide adenosyltransferase n=1 Tax=unclassified Iodidimonas TaxID=2626145 RepID=UPI0024827666|nr:MULTISPECIES: cob(I)yrinic acid a,c-diamide adenosyltransferase [unclassified Iodidimonas]
MVKLTKIYTRGGDQGETSLVDGSRVPKYAPRIEAFGSIDEANAVLGIVRLHSSGIIDDMLARIQNELFDLGADLATPPLDGAQEAGALRITDDQVTRLEQEIDVMNERLSPLSSFILPGGSPVAAYLHLARTIVRRAERLMVLAGQDTEINAAARKYANRLSDHLFVLSRIANENGAQDVLWKPGATRQKG